MSDTVILKRSFNEKVNKTSKISLVDDGLMIETADEKKSVSYIINQSEITLIDILNGKCPTPQKRAISYLIGLIAVIFFILGIIFKNNKILLAVFAILGIVIFFIAGAIAKKIYNASNDAIQFVVYKNNKKYITILGVNTTTKDYNNLLKLARELKRENSRIKLNMQTSK
jgi:type IV secretory pathway VirB2 component (pilin)